MKLNEIIRELCAVPAPAGLEAAAAERCARLISPYVDEWHTDALGNMIAFRRCGRPDAPCILLNAHIDEIGFVITGFERGFARFEAVGGVDPALLPAADIMVLTDRPLYGVVDVLPPHVLSAEDMDKTLPIDKLVIDLGLSQEEAEAALPIGTYAVFAGGVESLGENRLAGKAMDDRACAAIVIKAMEELSGRKLETDIAVLLSVQEELGMRGARVGAFSVRPDCAVCLDVTHAVTPDGKKVTIKLGEGPAIGVGPNMHRAMSAGLFDAAAQLGIKHQTEVLSGCSGTDAWVIQVSRSGVPTALVSLPLRYMHTPVEVMDLEDAEGCVQLLAAFVARYGREVSAHA